MHVKNHMPMWSLWFLWFLCVRYSGNPLYKPFCSFLVFVDLVWFLCGSFCGFWSRVVFGFGLRVRSCSCGFCGSVVCASTLRILRICPQVRRKSRTKHCAQMPMIARFCLLSHKQVTRKLPASCQPQCRCRPLARGHVVMWSCSPRCASSCSLWTAKKICQSTHFVLCSVSSPLEATFTNGENDHG